VETGLGALLVCVFFTTAFAQLLRLGQRLGCNMKWVGGLNYWWGAIVCAALAAGLTVERRGWAEVVLGALIGFGLIGGYFAMNAGVRLVGVGITQTAERLSSVFIPTLAAVVLWRERPSAANVSGLALASISLVLIGVGRGARGPAPGRDVGVMLWVGLISAMVLVAGWNGIGFKIYAEMGGERLRPGFFLSMFVAAALGNLLYAGSTGSSPGRRDWLVGIMLGTVNVTSVTTFYVALAHLDAVVVFPSLAAGVVVIGAAASALLWGERYNPWALAGIVLAIAALLLIHTPPRNRSMPSVPRVTGRCAR